jgi:branched-chain amino acid transport system substrate-binding protein
VQLLKRSGSTLLAVALVSAVTGSAADAGGGGGQPIKLVLLAETTGESTQAQADYANGAELAVDDLKGKVEVTRIPAPLAASGAQNALLQAFDARPAGIIGFPASSQLVPLGSRIGQEGIPFIALSAAEEAQLGGPSGAENLFLVRPLNTLIAREEALYVAKNLKPKPKRVGLLCVDNPFGTSGCAEAKRVLEKERVRVTVERTNATTATDLTEQALAMEDVDVVMDFNFPNPLAVFAKQLIDNGIDIPHVDGASAGISVQSGAIRGKPATNLTGVDDCVPTKDKRSRVKKWVKEYRAKFDADPQYNAAETYDAVQMFNAAVKKAGSTDPAAVIKELKSLEYNGICTRYRADRTNVLNHAADLVKFDANGAKKTVKHFTVGELAVPGATTTVATTAPSTTTTPPTSGP